jgi:hypothetical protein
MADESSVPISSLTLKTCQPFELAILERSGHAISSQIRREIGVFVFSEVFEKKEGGGVPEPRFFKFGTTPQFYDGFEMKPIEIMLVSLVMRGL